MHRVLAMVHEGGGLFLDLVRLGELNITRKRFEIWACFLLQVKKGRAYSANSLIKRSSD
jgi:hypothetical protein